MKYEQIKKQAEEAIKELLEKTHLKKDDIFVVGCSSSEIKGEASVEAQISTLQRRFTRPSALYLKKEAST